ncbi:MAG: hypothetical protein JXA23_06965 [Bacteroidales bacterium]|nr:hypothetical protein [Bacteroidales bacterium]
MKRFIILTTLLTSLISCEKNADIPVRYHATGAISPFTVTYLDETGSLVTLQIPVASAEDEWDYSFTSRQGEIVYLSAIYKDITSGINLSILVDGKIYKQASSNFDTIHYVIVSGTIPF